MSLLTILQPDETFTRRVEGAADAVLTLRVPGDPQVDVFRKRNRSTKWVNGQHVEEFDAFAFAADIVDASIVCWVGVVAQGGQALPCERATKLMLPEKVKAEVVRLCLGKEAGLEGGDSAGEPLRPTSAG